MEIQLNPALDVAKLAPDYARKGRIQIRDFFATDTAEAIHKELYGLPWHLCFNQGDTVHNLTPEQLAGLDQQQAAEIQQVVHTGARGGYQFLYNDFPLFERYFRDGGEGQALYRLYEFVNSPAMLDFFRRLTGLEDIAWADGHATLYRAGHFLKFHTDQEDSEQRLAAYVLNFTKDWGRDWGGLLQFWDEGYDVEQAYRPVFNALNIFTVPADHSVSAVVPWCEGLRFSVTGWLRGGKAPGPIPAN